MTNVYFIRHAESNASITDGSIRPLTEKGLLSRARVNDFLQSKGDRCDIIEPV